MLWRVMIVIAREGTPDRGNPNVAWDMSKSYYVYIATNDEHYILYTGVTNNIHRRIFEHTQGIGSKFTEKYTVDKLVYVEAYQDVNEAIAREKQIKAGSRDKKLALIHSLNPHWNDLSATY